MWVPFDCAVFRTIFQRNQLVISALCVQLQVKYRQPWYGCLWMGQSYGNRPRQSPGLEEGPVGRCFQHVRSGNCTVRQRLIILWDVVVLHPAMHPDLSPIVGVVSPFTGVLADLCPLTIPHVLCHYDMSVRSYLLIQINGICIHTGFSSRRNGGKWRIKQQKMSHTPLECFKPCWRWLFHIAQC